MTTTPIQPTHPHSQPPIFDTEYAVPSGVGWKAAGALAAGGFFLLLVLVNFALLILAAPSRPSRGGGGMESGWVGGMGAGAFFFLAYGFSLLRRPVRARLTPREIVIEGFVSRRSVPWDKVATLRRDKKTELVGHQTYDVLVLLDEQGKTLATLAGNFVNFPALVADVEARSAAARGAPTYDRDAEARRKAKEHHRSRRKTLVLSAVLLAFGLTAVSWGTYEWWKDRTIRNDGIDTAARLDRHYMIRVTGWIAFSFKDPATGRLVSRETSVSDPAWRTLEGQKTVTVRYVPSNPEWNKVPGEDDGGDSPLVMVGLGAALSVVFIAIFVFTALGYADLSVKDGKLRVKRYGEVDDALEPAAPANTGFVQLEEILPPQATGGMPTWMPAPPGAQPPMPQPIPAEVPPPPGWTYGSPFPTGYPYPTQPLPGTSAVPAGVKVVAVLNILFGVFGLLLNGGRALFMFVNRGQVVRWGQVAFVVENDPLTLAWMTADAVLALALAVSAIGLFRLRRWGRRLALGVAALQLVSSAVVLASAIYGASALSGLGEEDHRHAVAAMTGQLVGAVVGAIYPAVILTVLGRRSAATAFQPDEGPVSR
jgi:hypothetical protein